MYKITTATQSKRIYKILFPYVAVSNLLFCFQRKLVALFLIKISDSQRPENWYLPADNKNSL
jgi:hypothetical protein